MGRVGIVEVGVVAGSFFFMRFCTRVCCKRAWERRQPWHSRVVDHYSPHALRRGVRTGAGLPITDTADCKVKSHGRQVSRSSGRGKTYFDRRALCRALAR